MINFSIILHPHVDVFNQIWRIFQCSHSTQNFINRNVCWRMTWPSKTYFVRTETNESKCLILYYDNLSFSSFIIHYRSCFFTSLLWNILLDCCIQTLPESVGLKQASHKCKLQLETHCLQFSPSEYCLISWFDIKILPCRTLC